jgi:hypothetical protein
LVEPAAAVAIGSVLVVGIAAFGQEDPPPTEPDGASIVDEGRLVRGVTDLDFSDAAVAADFGAGEEIPGLRTETSRTRATATPGVFSTELFDAPVHFQRPDGSWRRIDTDLTPPATGGDLHTAATPVRV